MEFSTLTRRVAEATGVDTSKVQASVVPVKFWPPEGAAHRGCAVARAGGVRGRRRASGRSDRPGGDRPIAGCARVAFGSPQGDVLSTPGARAAAAAEAIKAVPLVHSAYETVTELDRLQAWVSEAASLGVVSFDTETKLARQHAGRSRRRVPGDRARKGLLHPPSPCLGDGDLLGGGSCRARSR